MSSSDETYLEAFIESLATLPDQVRRNMDLLKDLDASCSVELERLQQLQRQYILAAEEKMLNLQVVEMMGEEDGEEGEEGDDSDHTTNAQKAAPPKFGVRVLNEDGSPSNQKNAAVVIPTTDELMAYTYQEHAETYTQIRRLQKSCLQKSDEKVAVARQAYERIDAQVQRLDADLAAMESLLQAQGEYGYGTSSSTAGGGPGGAGGTVVAKPNDLAACQVTPGSEWILAKVIRHDPGAGIYTLADEDVESNKIFDLPEQQVIVLNGIIDRLSKGDVVFAVYPDTTSFYQATVVQAPRKQQQSSSNSNQQQFVMVNFVDDSDEFGITHDKAVPLLHLMPPPYDA